jgi:hypothetical protein
VPLTAVLCILLVLHTVGSTVFARFETETPIARRLFKWTLIHGGTIALYFVIGGWCLLWPGFMFGLGVTAHIIICRRQGFHPIYATPRRKYYAFRGWTWPEE